MITPLNPILGRNPSAGATACAGSCGRNGQRAIRDIVLDSGFCQLLAGSRQRYQTNANSASPLWRNCEKRMMRTGEERRRKILRGTKGVSGALTSFG